MSRWWLLALTTLLVFAWVAQRTWQSDAIALDRLLPLLPLLAIPSLAAGLLLRARPSNRVVIALILLVGVAIRLAFLCHEPFFSDDVYRYLWDGRVQVSGLSPYGVPPESPLLDGVERSWPPDQRVRMRVNHPAVPTIYPPVLELVFRGVATVGGGLVTWRGLLLIVELAMAFLLMEILRSRGRDPAWMVLYFWHPLPVIESIWSAHTEVFAVFLLLAGAHALNRKQNLLAGLLLGLGGAAKLLPYGLLLWPLRQGRWRCLAGATVTTLFAAACFLDTPLDSAFSGLSTYAEQWYFNEPLFRPLGFLLGLDPEDRTLLSTQLWRRGLQIAWLLVCVVAAWRLKNPLAMAAAMGVGFVMLTPTLHPWYLLWVLPFAVIFRSAAGFLLATTVLMSYTVRIGYDELGVWVEHPAIRILEFLPPALVLIWELVSQRRLRRPAALRASSPGAVPDPPGTPG